MKKDDTVKTDAIQRLQEMIHAGDTLYTVLRHVSSSGMSRCISVYVIHDNTPVCLDFWTSRALGLRRDEKRDGLIVGGSGMDMGFWLVYNLEGVVFGTQYKLNQSWL